MKFSGIRGKIVVRTKKLLAFAQNLNCQMFIPKIFSDEVCQTFLCEVLLYLQTVRIAETIHIGLFLHSFSHDCVLVNALNTYYIVIGSEFCRIRLSL